jgi:hypothetical protein
MDDEEKKENQPKAEGKEENRGAIIPGVILVVLGILFLLPKLGINFGDLWPTFLLAPGLAFFAFYFISKDKVKNAGVLIPATIITLLSIYFYFESLTNWKYAEKMWPVYPLIVSMAFFVTYFAGQKKDKGLLVPAWILLAVGLLFLVINLISVNLWPLFLILAGLYFIVFPRKS